MLKKCVLLQPNRFFQIRFVKVIVLLFWWGLLTYAVPTAYNIIDFEIDEDG